MFNVLSDFGVNRFEELNNYSGRMTRRKNGDSDAHKGLERFRAKARRGSWLPVRVKKSVKQKTWSSVRSEPKF